MNTTDKEKHLKRSKVFCLLPWTHLSVAPNGTVLPCCVSPARMGHTRESSLEAIWNSPKMRALRQDMLAGRQNSACRRCYDDEASGMSSYRQWANKEFAHHWGNVSRTGAQGFAAFNPPFLDIRFSNSCNFRCRICGPHFSTGWYKDTKKLALPPALVAGAPDLALRTAARDRKELQGWLDAFLPHAEAIRFQGGEPLMMPEHYQVLDFLLARRIFGVRLIYNTNFSVTRFEGRDVMRLWDRFKRVDVSASLDGMGRRGEYLRKGQSWPQVVRNRERMMRVCPRVNFRIAPTLYAMNALHLPDFHEEWVKRGYISADSIHINVLRAPKFYSCRILPPNLKSMVARRYQKHIEEFLRPRKASQAEAGFSGAVQQMLAEDFSGYLPLFRQATADLDKIRRENFLNVFPELSGLFEKLRACASIPRDD